MPELDDHDDAPRVPRRLATQKPAAPETPPQAPTITLIPTRAVTTIIADHGATITVVEDEQSAISHQQGSRQPEAES